MLRANILNETSIKNPNSFEEVSKKFSPNELLNKGNELGIIGNKHEVIGLKRETTEVITITNFLPKERGEWSGEVGDSTWIPNHDEIPKRPLANEQTWGEILDKYDIEGIEFKDGEANFSTVSEGKVEIGDFSTDRNANFTQADEQLAEKWTNKGKDGKEWSPQEIKEYRKENSLSWHERSDMKTMDLTPQEVHGNIPHSGGISVAKRDKNSSGS